MTFPAHFSIDILREIKHWNPDDQVSMLLEASGHFLHAAANIRAALDSLSGVVFTINVKGQDQEVVLLALLAVLANDIVSLPDSRLRAKSMLLHEEVVRRLDMETRDAEFFRLNFKLFEPLLMDEE